MGKSGTEKQSDNMSSSCAAKWKGPLINYGKSVTGETADIDLDSLNKIREQLMGDDWPKNKK